MAESGIVKQTLIELPSPTVRVWRQNVAKLPDASGQWIQFNIPGMADIGGIAGPGGWLLQIEMKKGKGHRNKKTIEAQANWERMIRSHGGIYLLARSAEEAADLLDAELEKRRKEWTSGQTDTR